MTGSNPYVLNVSMRRAPVHQQPALESGENPNVNPKRPAYSVVTWALTKAHRGSAHNPERSDDNNEDQNPAPGAYANNRRAY